MSEQVVATTPSNKKNIKSLFETMKKNGFRLAHTEPAADAQTPSPSRTWVYGTGAKMQVIQTTNFTREGVELVAAFLKSAPPDQVPFSGEGFTYNVGAPIPSA